jgi:hypothetical protein
MLYVTMNTTNTTTSAALDTPIVAPTANTGNGNLWLYWLGTVLLIRFFMVERKFDGARFGLVGLINGAVGRMGDGEDEEWAALYSRLQATDSTTMDIAPNIESTGSSVGGLTASPSKPSNLDTAASKRLGRLPQRTRELTIGSASIGMRELWLRKKLWSRWMVDMFTWHRMYWFGPSVEDPDGPGPQQSRRRLGTVRNRYGDRDTQVLFPANPDQLTLIYGTKSVVVAEGTGRVDSLATDRRWKAQRYGIYFVLFGVGLSIHSIWLGLIVTVILESLLFCSWFLGRNLSDEHQNFCTRVSRSAECIEQAARTLVPKGIGEGGGGKRTLDVVLHHGSTMAWCRCAPTEHPVDPEHRWDNNTWMSLCIPKSHPIADTAFAGLGLLSHTLLPWGWVRFRPNLFFAGLAAMLESVQTGMGLIVILIFAPMPTWLGYPAGVWQHEDNWTLAWYVCMTLWMSGYAIDFQTIIEWVQGLLTSGSA